LDLAFIMVELLPDPAAEKSTPVPGQWPSPPLNVLDTQFGQPHVGSSQMREREKRSPTASSAASHTVAISPLIGGAQGVKFMPPDYPPPYGQPSVTAVPSAFPPIDFGGPSLVQPQSQT